MDKFGFFKVAVATPVVAVGDPRENVRRITALAREAAQRGAELVVFPELSMVGYTAGDLMLQRTLLDAVDEALRQLADASLEIPLTIVVGAPLRHGASLYDTAVVIAQGQVQGVVPKSHVFEGEGATEKRLFTSGFSIDNDVISAGGDMVPFGAFQTFAVNGVEVGIELSHDLWALVPNSSLLAQNGAKIICNLAAVMEGAAQYNFLQQQILSQSARTISGYVYASAGSGESTTNGVFGGSALIAENGKLLMEGERFLMQPQLIVADIDTDRLDYERRRNPMFREPGTIDKSSIVTIDFPESDEERELDREIDPMPFIPHEERARWERCQEVFQIQVQGLVHRLTHTRARTAVIGISGGLDSTLALLVMVRAFDVMQRDRKEIIGVTMPGFGTTGRTYNNALKMMNGLGITVHEIPIRKACEQHFEDIGLDASDRSAAYENSQARERTQILMDLANKQNGLVVGTGDLSELALGWATYNGDHMSMYGVNATVPKTLVRHVVAWCAENEQDEEIRRTLFDVIETPVSPELLPADEQGEIAQKTEDLVGPYELHDFFLHHFISGGACPAKILYMAEEAFCGTYDRETILKWLRTFFRRFFSQQFKRSALPDGPRTGRISLSPRGDWEMPSDMLSAAWLEEIDKL